MNIIDKIGQSLGLNGIDEKIDESNEIETPKESAEKSAENAEQSVPRNTPKNVFDFNSASALSRDNSSARTVSSYIDSEIKTIKPKNFNDAQIVADLLRDKTAVVINLEETDSVEAQRIVDFISGTVYAVSGTMRPISRKVFIAAPDNVKIEAYEDERKPKNGFID